MRRYYFEFAPAVAKHWGFPELGYFDSEDLAARSPRAGIPPIRMTNFAERIYWFEGAVMRFYKNKYGQYSVKDVNPEEITLTALKAKKL